MPKDLPTVKEVSDGYAMLKLSHQSTKQEMEIIAAELFASQGVTIDFSNSEFFDDGKLRKLRLSVMCPNERVGSTTADLVALQFHYYGFLYQKTGSPSFKIGAL